jgi:hypothetical protein
MANLIDVLKARGVDKAFAALRLDMGELFQKRLTKGTTHAYDHHEWEVHEDPVRGPVVSAVPQKAMIEELAWEEWLSVDGSARHRILSLKRPSRYDDVFVAPDQDATRPRAVLGRTWYIVNDPDLSPLLLRRHT